MPDFNSTEDKKPSCH